MRRPAEQLSFFIILPCERLRTLCPCTLPLQLTPPGTLTAHTKSTLVLLHSCPDTVRRHVLRKTQTSSPLIKGCYINANPLLPITPTIADCRYKAPLTPQLHGSLIITSFVYISQCYCAYFYFYFWASFSSLFRLRSSTKNSFSIRLHSSSNTPLTTST